MKLATFHKRRGDDVTFVNGCDPTLFDDNDPFSDEVIWDRVYITTLFTFDWQNVIKTINFYREAIGGSIHKIFVGGVMASLMTEEIFEETGIYPVRGVIKKPREIGLDGDEEIDLLPPDYEILDPKLYAINDTFYGYSTRGCTQKCPWCGVPGIEPNYLKYIDIKPCIMELRSKYGDLRKLKLMDNNVLASPDLGKIVDDLVELGYGRNEFTKTDSPKMRVVDFNQGLDATHITAQNLKILQRLNIRPMRVAFDRIQERDTYVKALALARSYGFREFSNYMLYNWKDSPRDLYDRLVENISLNEEWKLENGGEQAVIYSYPMRFAPIFDPDKTGANRNREWVDESLKEPDNFLTGATWNRRFIRNIEIIKGAAHGAISPTPDYALRAIGESYKEYIANLYMPEEMLRNRNKYEARIYPNDPNREPGTGELEEFREEFIYKKIAKPDDSFREFHRIVTKNSMLDVRKGISKTKDPEVKHWLEYYLRKD
jgi:hypothetical protein